MGKDAGPIAVSLLDTLGVTVVPDSAPQEQPLPYVLYRAASGTAPKDLQGEGTIHQQVFTFDAVANTREEAAQIESNIADLFKTIRGTVAGYFVHSIYPQADYLYRRINRPDGSGSFWHIASFSYRFTFDEN